VAPLIVGVIAFAAARSAMLPGLGFWDTAELQAVAPLMGTAHPTGFPTYVLLGWLANLVLSPFGEPALRMNLFAGLCVAVASAATVDLARALTRSTALGVAAGLGLALTPSVWAIGTRADAHALHLALVVILLRLLVGWGEVDRGEVDRAAADRAGRDRWLIAAAVVFGLSVGNHSLTLLLAVPVGLYVVAVEPAILRRPGLIAACIGSLTLAIVVVFLELPLRAGPFRAPMVYGEPHTWDGFWYIVLAEQFRGSLASPLVDLGGKLDLLLARAWTQFGPLAILVPAGFLATVVTRPRYALLSGTALAITVLFAMSYANADVGRYYLGPILIAWTWLAVLGSAAFANLSGAGSAVHPPRLAVAGLVAVLVVPPLAAAPDTYRSVDASRDVSARDWVDRAFAAMEPDALIVSWWSYSTPLWYAQHVESQRPDVTIVDDRTRLDQDLGDIIDVIDANLAERPVYVIRADPREVKRLEERYVLRHLDGPDARHLTRIVARREGGS